ncbi:hypothetical protein [Moorena sp. SIO4G3]|uniref:hypothetical protein n=1 Tax=Moorena sp. SIO4G3 TaxID=2607821 RepID=UPI0025E6FC60|nr:hypothetical protein [Moorena sp. SIO4G3]
MRESGVGKVKHSTIITVPCSLFPVPNSRFPIPDSRFPIPDSRFPLFSALQTIQLLG